MERNRALVPGDARMSRFEGHVRTLVEGTIRACGREPADFVLRLDIQHNRPDADLGLNCGRIIAGLVESRLRNGAPASGGEIRVTFRHTGGHAVLLSVGDSWSGACENAEATRDCDTGLKAVGLLIDRLHGSIEFVGHRGDVFRAVFPEGR